MSGLRLAVVLFALVGCLLVSCMHEHRTTTETGPLAEALRFHERDRFGVPRELGGKRSTPIEGTAGGVEVPAPALVDVDSLVDIAIDKRKLVTGQPSRLDGQAAQKMLTEHDWLQVIVTRIRELAGSQTQFADIYQAMIRARDEAGVAPSDVLAFVRENTDSPLAEAYRRFTVARDALDKREGEIFNALSVAYGKSDDEDELLFADELEEAAALPAPLERLGDKIEERLRKKIADTNSAQERWLAPLQEEGPVLELQLEAWLLSGDKRAQIHLPGYDTLDEGQVTRRHVGALDLSGADRERLQQQWQSTVSLANSLESYRIGKAELRDVLGQTKTMLAPEVGALLDSAGELHETLKTIDLGQMVEDTKADVQRLAEKVEAQADTIADTTETKLKSIPLALQARLQTPEVVQMIADLTALRDQAANMTPEALPGMLFRARDQLRAALNLVADEMEDSFDAAVFAVQKFAEDEVKKVATELLGSDEVTRLMGRLDTIEEVFTKAHDVWKRLEEVLPLFGLGQGVPDNVGAVNIVRVPFDKIQSTHLDLLRTPRTEGDTVELRARLFTTGAAEPIDELSASFGVRKFGWHDRLSPSVVLVQPTKLQGRQENFAFAPVLSWVHRYGVRPDQGGMLASMQRFLDTSFGVHASFVDFDPDNEVEIGLGATVSLWNERLQMGAGVNMMADASDDGRFYYFIGSDLISLLNTVGIGK